MKNIMLSAITSIAKNLSPVLRFFRQRESVRATMSRVLILLMLAQPMLAHAAPFVHGAETTAQRGVAKPRSLMPKTAEVKAAEAPKPVMEKAIGIDEWMAQSNQSPTVIGNPTINNSSMPESPIPVGDPKNFTSPFKIFPAIAMFQTGTSLEMGTTGPAGSGPSTSSQAVTLFENAVTAYSPTTSVTYSLSNQQFPAGTVQGITSPGINFGGSGNSTADTPLLGTAIYGLMNSIGSATSAMFTACNGCTAGSSIDVATNRAISLNLVSDALINAANTNLQALNARVYYGDLTITFNRPVSNPVLQFVGMGGQTSTSTSVSGAVKSYDMGFSTEFDLVGSNVSLSKLNGNSVLTVTPTSITNSATRLGASSVGSVVNGITRTGASGSILATGTNITSITLKMYLRGDGGIVVNTAGVVQTPDPGWEPKWGVAAGYQPTGATTPFVGSVAGDTMLFGASIQKPVTVSGTVFNDTNGLSDSIVNGTGTNAGGLNAILVDSAGNVIASTAVAANGTYSFTGIGEGSYSMRLSTAAGVQGTAAPAISLPATWSNRGEGTVAAGDGTINGNTAITVAPGVNLSGVNFGIAQPSLSLAKANPASFAVGTAADYTLTVSNAANRPTSGTSIVVNEKLPPNIAYNSAAAGTGATGASCTSSGTLAAGLDLICTITTAAGIAGGSSAAFTLNVTPQTAAAGVAGINKAAVDPVGGTPIAPSTCTATGTPAGCALAPSITPTAPPIIAGYKSVKLTSDADSSGTVTAGDTLTYTLQYTNTGAGNASSFQINDVLPSGLTITSTGGQTITLSGAGTSATKNTAYTGATAGAISDLLAASATLGVGGVITVTIPVTIGIGVAGTKSNQASATGIGLSSAVLTDNAGATADLPSIVTAAPYNLTVPAGSVAQTIAATVDPTSFAIGTVLPDLKLLKVAPLSVQAGTALTYTMTVANVGLGATTGTISVVDELPTGVTVNGGASGSVTLSGLQAANWTCNSDALSPQTITCTSTTTMVASSGVSIFAFSADVAATVTNTLVNQAKVFGGGDPNKTTVTVTGAITACLAASENLAGSVTNAGCAFESTPVINVAGFKSVKLTTDADSSSSITPGDTLTYTLQYTNTGTVDATVFQLNDVLPTGLTKSGPLTITILLGSSVAVTNPLYTGAAAGTVSDLLLAGGILKAGGAITLTIPVTVNSGFSGTLSNQGTATALELSAAVLTDNAGATADLPATVTAAPYSLTVPTGSVAQTITTAVDPVTATVGISAPTVVAFKSVKLTTDADSSGTITAGDTLTWIVQYANTGTVDVPAFQIADQLPSGITITSAGAQTVTVTGAGTSATKDATYTGASLATSMSLTVSAILAQQGTITLTIPVTINAGFTGSLSNQASGSGTGMPAAVSTDNAGVTADLPATVTAAPYNLTVPASSVTQTIAATVDPTLAVVVAAPTVAAYKSVKLTTDADSSGSVTAGDTLAWTVQYANTGTVDVTGFQLNDTLPAGLTITGTGNQTLTITGSTTASKNTNYTGATAGAVSDLLLATTTFKAGDILKLEIPVTVNTGATGTLLNQALGTATNLPVAGVRTDNIDSVTSGLPSGVTVPTGSLTQTQNPPIDPTSVTIAVTPTVLAFKSVKLTTDVNSNSLPDPGDTLIWSVWYKNTGAIDVTTFQISDALPAGVTITGAGNQTVTITGTTTAAKSTTYTGAAAGAVSDLLSATTTFKAGDLIQIDIPVTINPGFAGSILNQAIGTGGNLPPTGVITDNADNVTPGLPSGVTIPTGSAVQTLTPASDPTSLAVAGIPMMTLVKSVTPTGDQQPGTDLTYQIVFTNTGNAAAQEVVIFDPIPNDTDFKLGSATMTLGTTGLTMVAEYSNDFVAATPATATWTYTPVTAGGGADTGYDRNVKAVRWRVSAGTLSQTSPNHTGDVGFVVKIR